MKSNAPDVAMSIAVFELLVADPADEDWISIKPPYMGGLDKACQWRCSMPWLEVEDALTMQRSHVDTLLYAVFATTLMLQPAT